MRAEPKVIQSGLRPESMSTRVLRHTEDICNAMRSAVQASIDRIHEVEIAAVDRLEKYVPTERLLDRWEAAAYLHLKIRQFDYLTRPAATEIPFNFIGGRKRFRKDRLDAWLDETEVKKKAVKL